MSDRASHWTYVPGTGLCSFPRTEDFNTLAEYFAACEAWHDARRKAAPERHNSIPRLFAEESHWSAEP